MPHYLIQASYAAQSISGLISSGEDRSGVIASLAEGLGGKVESFYQCFGDYDVMIVLELPDNVSMAALSMVAGASGGISNFKTTVLMPLSEGVEAARKAAGIGYRPPGS